MSLGVVLIIRLSFWKKPDCSRRVRRAAVTVAVAQFERAFVVVQREVTFFGEDDVVAAVFVLFAQEQVFHDAGFGIEGFDKINPAVALAQTVELACLHQRQFLLLLQDFSVFAAA